MTRISSILHLPVVIETVGGGHNPLAGDERPPADVVAPHLEAGLPWPLPLRGISPAHNTTGELPQAAVWKHRSVRTNRYKYAEQVQYAL